tara:strand:- start:493 stop:771 length:279 start_codon:yes stop_codon:yes gene_type:complete
MTQAQRAEEAQRILDSEVFSMAVAELELQYLNEWKNTYPEDVEGRERLHMAMSVLEEVQRHLRIVIQNGSLSGDRLIRLKAWHKPEMSDKQE